MPLPTRLREFGPPMWRRALCSPIRATFLALFLGLFAGCIDEDNPTAPETPRNPDLPNANAMVRYHRIDGDTAKRSSIYDLIDVGDNTSFGVELHNGVLAVTRLPADGVPIWTRRTGYSLRSAQRFDTLWNGLPTVCLAVGGSDSDGNGALDEGWVSLIDLDGGLVSELTLTPPDVELWLNDIAVTAVDLDVCEFLAVGGIEGPGGPVYPVVVQVALSSTGEPSLIQSHVYANLPGVLFGNVEHDPADALAATYASGNLFASDGSVISLVVVGLSPSLQLDWRQDLFPEETYQTSMGGVGGSLRLEDGNLYVVGGALVQKGTEGDLWSAGLIAALSADGSLQWLRVVTLTAHGEHFQRCIVDGPYVYVSGQCASFLIRDTNQEFGYALLSRVERLTGNFLDNWSFGDRDCSSGFNTVMVRGDRAFGGGWTHGYVDGGSFQSWYVDVDLAPASTAWLAAAAEESPDARMPLHRDVECGKYVRPRW